MGDRRKNGNVCIFKIIKALSAFNIFLTFFPKPNAGVISVT